MIFLDEFGRALGKILPNFENDAKIFVYSVARGAHAGCVSRLDAFRTARRQVPALRPQHAIRHQDVRNFIKNSNLKNLIIKKLLDTCTLLNLTSELLFRGKLYSEVLSSELIYRRKINDGT